eukprot:TRINITY_DN1181_c0_g1_i1.p1 TRINITY_DN1181_c0_g1~~TRINITY_DN1181_c0_g1_i1.p1  ORF type:complete len:688 (+),score=114.64 TRINITY_DN1181_c0_g1_i1:88-2151(+)
MRSSATKTTTRGKAKDSSVREIERPEWMPDESVNGCELCSISFSFTQRRHHCRGCGHIFCKEHCNIMMTLPPEWGYESPQRICAGCKIKFQKYAKTRLDRESDIESGVLVAQYYLRDKEFTYSTPLLAIGRRKPPLKNYFLVLPSAIGSSTEFLMSTVRSSSSLISTETTRQLFVAIMQTVRHPFILPVASVDYLLDKHTAVLIRPFSREGALRDKLHKVDPKIDFYKKYGAQAGSALGVKQVALYGRQILEAMSFLQSIRFSYPHLNASNIVVKDGKCCLTDLENSLLGLPPLYIQHFTNAAHAELVCFGHVLFQMAMGFTKAKASIQEFATKMPTNIYDILCSIFEPASGVPPTVTELLNNPFFSAVSISENVLDAKSQCILEDKAKIMLRRARRKNKEMIEQFLREQEEENGTANVGSLRISEQESNKAATASATSSATAPDAVASPKKETATTAATTPKTSSVQPMQGYSSSNPSDPLNPDNRKKAAMRAQMMRKQSSLQRKSSAKLNGASKPAPLQRTTSSPAMPASTPAAPSAPAPPPPAAANRATAAPPAAAAPKPPTAPAPSATPKAPAAPAPPPAPSSSGPPPPPPAAPMPAAPPGTYLSLSIYPPQSGHYVSINLLHPFTISQSTTSVFANFYFFSFFSFFLFFPSLSNADRYFASLSLAFFLSFFLSFALSIFVLF